MTSDILLTPSSDSSLTPSLSPSSSSASPYISSIEVPVIPDKTDSFESISEGTGISESAFRTQSCPEFPVLNPAFASSLSSKPSDEQIESISEKLNASQRIFPQSSIVSTKEEDLKNRLRALVVDDNHMNQHLLQTMLTRLVLFFPNSFFSNFLFLRQTSKRHYS